MHDIVKVHGRVVAQKLGDLVQFIPGHRDRQVAAPLDGLHKADSEVFLKAFGQLLKRHEAFRLSNSLSLAQAA